MKKFKTIILFLFVYSLILFVNFSGIKWGLPGEEKIKLVFENKENLLVLVPFLKITREEITDMMKTQIDEYSPKYNEREFFEIKMNDKIFFLNKGILNSMRTYLLRTYYQDEHVVLTALSNIDLKNKNFNTKMINPGGVYIYCLGIYLKMLDIFKIIHLENSIEYYLTQPDNLKKIYISIRIFSIIATLIGCFFLYLICKFLWDEYTGIVSAFLFGVSPIINLWNHFGYYYSYAVLWVIISLYFSIKILNEGRMENYILSGIFAGFSAGTCGIYGISLIFSVIAGLLYKIIKDKNHKLTKNLMVSISVSIFIFLIFNPYFFKNLFYIIKKPHPFSYQHFNFSPSFVYFIFGSMKSAIGLPFLLFSQVGLLFLFFSKGKKENIFFIFLTIFFTVFFGCFSPWYIRRSIFLIPFYSLLVGYFLYSITEIKSLIGKICLVIVCLYTFSYSYAYSKIFSEKNIRDIAGEWINLNIPQYSEIGITQYPSPYRTPPFHFHLYNIIPVGLDKEQLERTKPEYFILTEGDAYCYNRKMEDMITFLEEYRIIKRFEKIPEFLNIKFQRSKFSAIDIFFPNPTILILKRK